MNIFSYCRLGFYTVCISSQLNSSYLWFSYQPEVVISLLLLLAESANNQKLMLEYEKFQELQAKSQKMQEDYERQLQEMEENRERALEELTEYYETRIQEMTAKLEQVRKGLCETGIHVYNLLMYWNA